MTDLHDLFRLMWARYTAIAPQAERIHSLFRERGEDIVNDHIALRTFARSPVDIDAIAAPFRSMGYRSAGEYCFPEKKLFARHYECAEPGAPKLFISELLLDQCSDELNATVNALLNDVDPAAVQQPEFCASGRPWRVAFSTYERLRNESEYAAWVAAFGFLPNHFTVSVNALRTFHDLASVNDFLQQAGFRLNESGGAIKGSPEQYLEQSSTLADEVEVDFTDGRHRVPSCYYEFAKRYPLPSGELFHGFVATSADKIFESTDARQRLR